MYSTEAREQALRLLACGATIAQVSRELAISRSAIRQWRDHPKPTRASECPRCDPSVVLDTSSYAALLGFYLGDGCLSAAKRYYALL